MRLLLDEMIRHAVAEQLRARGHDVVAINERPELRSVSDGLLLDRATAEGRAVVTYNRDDFIGLDRERRQSDRPHADIVIVNPHRFPEGRSMAKLVASLDAFISAGEQYPVLLTGFQVSRHGLADHGHRFIDCVAFADAAR